REGCRWRALPEYFGHWMMVFMRYKRWIERGVWWKVLMRLQKAKVLEVKVAFIDSTVVRAHRHAAGARKKGGAKH
ncbi:MAG: transposase, partial [Desulfovibrionaceae bacterium]|nr:transposase [Desulfovibrionaceae bacterium]